MSERFKKRPGYILFDQHQWADFYELVCLVNIDGELDRTSMMDRVGLKERDGVDLGTYDSSEDDEGQDPVVSGQTEKEKNELRFLDYFKYFKFREAKFQNFYPFVVEDHKISLKAGYTESLDIKLYIYLLCCSSLSYFRDIQGTLTSDFELISLSALIKLLPINKNHHLGKVISGGKREYEGNVYDKLEQLAVDLSANIRVSRSDFATTSSGDGGLDLISWYSFNDSQNSIPTYGGQCKCSPEWINAKDPSTLLEGYFDLDHSPVNMFFIPFDYRKSNGRWHQLHNIKNKVVIDRLRLCELLSGQLSAFSGSDAHTFIETFLTEKESII